MSQPAFFSLDRHFGEAAPEEAVWPAGTVVLSPLLRGAAIVAQRLHPRVVAIPIRHAAPGMERGNRFLGPDTGDCRAALAESRATHVAPCVAADAIGPQLRAWVPFAPSLVEGQPPVWLKQCPVEAGSPLRVYAIHRADGFETACPAPFCRVSRDKRRPSSAFAPVFSARRITFINEAFKACSKCVLSATAPTDSIRSTLSTVRTRLNAISRWVMSAKRKRRGAHLFR